MKEVSSSYKEVQQSILNDPNQNLGLSIDHKEFVDGLKSNKLFYTFVGEPASILIKRQRATFNVLVVMYIVAPLVLVPFFCYHFNNWWLLFGIPFSYVGSVSGAWKIHIPAYLMLYFIGEAIAGHWHFKDYDDFFYICLLWGYLWFRYANEYQRIQAHASLLNHDQVYYDAVKSKKLIVLKVESEDDMLNNLKALKNKS
jgi:hypothetical protein